MPFSRSIQEISDFIYWTAIGLAAAVWAFIATKLRNLGKKVLYIIMLLPLFVVISIELIGNTFVTIMFFVTGGGIMLPESSLGTNAYIYNDCQISGALTSLIVCLYKFLISLLQIRTTSNISIARTYVSVI